MNEHEPGSDPDLLQLVLDRVTLMAPGFTEALARQVEDEIRAEYGGQRVSLPKRGKRITPERRAAIFKDGLTQMPTEEITSKHNISRATLYRLMKRSQPR